MTTRHANISVFVPHIGCPGRCSFCDQTKIACTAKQPSATDVHDSAEEAMKSQDYDPTTTEIAFFGGSFTAISEEYMVELLTAAEQHIKSGHVAGIRVSTRPDAVDEYKLSLLKKYGVTAVELGAQSMDNRVLELNRRGHTAEAVKKASALVKEYGISLGLQMMTGLLGDTDEGAVNTAREFVELRPDTVRIYPTIVLKGTMLERMYREGDYRPQDLKAAVELSARLLDIFSSAGISVIRLGLHEIDRDSYVAGPWHPAFGELTQSAVALRKIKEKVQIGGMYTVYCNPSDISKTVGQKRCNITALVNMGIKIRVAGDETLGKGELRVVKEN